MELQPNSGVDTGIEPYSPKKKPTSKNMGKTVGDSIYSPGMLSNLSKQSTQHSLVGMVNCKLDDYNDTYAMIVIIKLQS